MSQDQPGQAKLWDRGEPVDGVIARFTVGRDPELDLHLVPYDALASAAHATMLAAIGILHPQEREQLCAELGQIAVEASRGTFVISTEEEDGHTAIENRLTARLGDAGRKIHTGRSRNDQVIAALRLWGREQLLVFSEQTLALVERLLTLAAAERETSMPGFTHTRQAMPSTLGHYFAAHAEGLLDALTWHRAAFNHLDRSPLGSASGYGVALPLDRQQVCDLLGFSSLQINSLAVQNDRGKSEYLALSVAAATLTDLARLAHDLIWWSSDELRWITLAVAVTTGSSIMPQKRNPDVLELVRAMAARLRQRAAEVASIYGGLYSGYQRDLQLTKEPYMEGLRAATEAATAMGAVLNSLTIDRGRCRAALLPTTAATDEVYRQVGAGVPFRSAYRAVAADPAAAVQGLQGHAAQESWTQRDHVGSPARLELERYQARLREERQWAQATRARVAAVWTALLPGAAGS